MKVLKEAKQQTFNPFTDMRCIDMAALGKDAPEEIKEESLITEDQEEQKWENPCGFYGPKETSSNPRERYGTCFQRVGHPSIYGITYFKQNDPDISFQAFDHEYGNHWRTDIWSLTKYFQDGTFVEVSDADLAKALSY